MARASAATRKQTEAQDALDLTPTDTAAVAQADVDAANAADASAPAGTELQIGEAATEIAEYNPLVQELARITEQYKNVVWDVTTDEGFKAAKEARTDVQKVRYAIQNSEKAVLKPYQDAVKAAQASVNAVKEFGSDLRDKVLVIEAPIDQLVRAEEERQKAEKDRLASIARERAERIDSTIQGYRLVGATYSTATAAAIAEQLDTLKSTIILPDEYGDREGEAMVARDNAIDTLTALHSMTVSREADAQRLADQQAELEQLRVQQRKAAEEAEQRRQEQARRDAEELQRQRDQLAEQQRILAEGMAELQRLRDGAAAAPAPPAAHTHTANEPARVETTAPAAAEPIAIVVVEPVKQPDPNAPNAEDLVETIGLAFDVPPATARHWLRTTPF